MDKMEWALWSLDYLSKARGAIHEDFNGAMEDLKGYDFSVRQQSWYSSCKGIITMLYHRSLEFAAHKSIPSEDFASPDVFEAELSTYRAFVQQMQSELDAETKTYKTQHKADPPFLVEVARRLVASVAAAIDYVESKKPHAPAANPLEADVDLILGLARRFHESVVSLKTHPHKGAVLAIKDEWDCQYLFRSILAAYIADVRDEEWNPSVGGSSTRCEFYLKTLRTLVELKFVRKAMNAKKIKSELATDYLDYGKNPQVDRLICLIYDPDHALKNPASMITDLSGPKDGLERVDVVISPPRD